MCGLILWITKDVRSEVFDHVWMVTKISKDIDFILKFVQFVGIIFHYFDGYGLFLRIETTVHLKRNNIIGFNHGVMHGIRSLDWTDKVL